MLRRAFTLIELLVVVAIIALLISILLPSLSGARDQARNVKCLSQMRQLSYAIELYARESGEFLPPWGLAHGGSGNPLASWITKLGPEFAAYYDPNAGGPPSNYLLRCPSDRSEFWSTKLNGVRRQSSYASNYLLAHGPYKKNRLSRIPKPESTIFWVELVEENVENKAFPVADHVHPDNWVQNLAIASTNDELERLASAEVQTDQHPRGSAKLSHYGFLDGHAAPLRFQETFACDFANTSIFKNQISWFRNKYDPDVAR